MKPQIAIPLLLALGLTFCAGTMAADATGRGGIYANESADGGVVLSNIASTDDQEAMVAAPDPAAAAAEPKAKADKTAAADAPKDPREQYRDNMLQGTPGTTAENPSVSRRYKMMDRATYRASVLGITPETLPTKSQ